MQAILGKKVNMTQKFSPDGTVTPVTAVLAGPCVVTQVRTKEKDTYEAVQLGFGVKKHPTKSEAGHTKDLGNLAYLCEFRAENDSKLAEIKRGDKVTVANFSQGDVVQVVGTSKGKGFQGVVKRHHFHCQNKTHGHKDQNRMPGSIGDTGPQRVFKGKRMAGHMGDERVTIKNLKIIDIDQTKNLLYIQGALPGARNGLLEIRVTKPAAGKK
ncbi:MAG: 50S ribosomal protein L3 [Patescibacteria group bacterium]